MSTLLTDPKHEGTPKESKENVVSGSDHKECTLPGDTNFLLQTVPVLPRNWSVVTDKKT